MNCAAALMAFRPRMRVPARMSCLALDQHGKVPGTLALPHKFAIWKAGLENQSEIIFLCGLHEQGAEPGDPISSSGFMRISTRGLRPRGSSRNSLTQSA